MRERRGKLRTAHYGRHDSSAPASAKLATDIARQSSQQSLELGKSSTFSDAPVRLPNRIGRQTLTSAFFVLACGRESRPSGLNRRTNGGRVKREKGRLRWLTVYSHRPLTPRAYRLTRRSEERRGRYARLSLANLMAFSEEALPNVLRWFRTRIVRAGVPVIFKATPQFPVRGTPLFAAKAQGAADYYLIGDRSRTTD